MHGSVAVLKSCAKINVSWLGVGTLAILSVAVLQVQFLVGKHFHFATAYPAKNDVFCTVKKMRELNYLEIILVVFADKINNLPQGMD